MVPKDKERTTEDLFSVSKGVYNNKKSRFIENFMSLEFLFKIIKKMPCWHGQIFTFEVNKNCFYFLEVLLTVPFLLC